jgi:phage terminase large subunit-like protein
MSPAESVEPAELSPAGTLMHALVAVAGKDAAAAIVEAELAKLTVVERAALSAYWPAWARPSQLPPETAWRSFGFLGARGIGKTRSLAEFVTSEAYEGRAMEIGLAAQKEDDATVQVEALIKASPPWFPATWEPSKLVLVWPNGARARVFTPEVPGSIRGKEFHLVWLSELQSWPVATMEEAMLNFAMATRLGYARTVWDATPKRRHPLLMERLAMHNDDPETHVLRRGSTYENAANLGPGVVAELERKYGGTSRAKEELLGEMIEGEDAALFTQVNLDLHRSECPRLVRKVLGLDPAVTERAGSDRTGIVLAGIRRPRGLRRFWTCTQASGSTSLWWKRTRVAICLPRILEPQLANEACVLSCSPRKTNVLRATMPVFCMCARFTHAAPSTIGRRPWQPPTSAGMCLMRWARAWAPSKRRSRVGCPRLARAHLTILMRLSSP